MNVIKLTAPSAWACFLVNGDADSMSHEDLMQAIAWINREGLPAPVSCEDAGFRWHHDASIECPLGADCQEYVFLT